MVRWVVPDTVEDYAARHTTPLPPLLQELEAATRERTGGRAAMLSGQVAGMVLQSLVAAMGARRVLELGTFTGLSALMMASALPDDGQLITCDVDAETTRIAREFWARSPHGHKIELRLGPALETIKTLQGPFDFVFIDADKPAYVDYYEAVLPLLAPRGVIVADNALRRGRVLAPENEGDASTAAFNDHVQHDPRTVNVLLTVRDGMMLIRRA
jgi:caffeoyl-CoA O-methyltransferase